MAREIADRFVDNDDMGRGWYHDEIKRTQTALRELQRQAMEAVLAEQNRCLQHRWPWSPSVVDLLLDGPAPEGE
jgi:hypothetical protein